MINLLNWYKWHSSPCVKFPTAPNKNTTCASIYVGWALQNAPGSPTLTNQSSHWNSHDVYFYSSLVEVSIDKWLACFPSDLRDDEEPGHCMQPAVHWGVKMTHTSSLQSLLRMTLLFSLLEQSMPRHLIMKWFATVVHIFWCVPCLSFHLHHTIDRRTVCIENYYPV